ncbi:MAG: hypothetical protein IKD29_05345, partial [Lentisphaeria bacterium]|nr:hypothetical protein [Lentisphaeria bacterium]
ALSRFVFFALSRFVFFSLSRFFLFALRAASLLFKLGFGGKPLLKQRFSPQTPFPKNFSFRVCR